MNGTKPDGVIPNGTTPNGDMPDGPALRILIVGAGIGGLAAGVALRRQGHHVLIYERSQFKAEHGAAITIAPNATGALLSIGVDIQKYGAVQNEWFSVYDQDKLVFSASNLERAHLWQNKWLMCHRVDLHNCLREHAVDPNGVGRPCELHLGSKVVQVDTTNAMIGFEDGSAVFGDVIIGADGVHSVTRGAISDAKPFPSGRSAYRFILDREVVQADPVAREFLQKLSEMKLMCSPDEHVIMYPCRWNKIISVAIVHSDSKSEATSAEYNRTGSKDAMLARTERFGPQFQALARLADPDGVKVWKLMDMAVLPTWVKGKLALLGDASHPFLPYQAQGGAIAIEDAITLGEVLPLGTMREDIAERLKLYESFRMERANHVQQLTRIAGRTHPDYIKAQGRAGKTMASVFLHQEHHNSSDRFRRYLYEKEPNSSLTMPTGFGPRPSPQQTVTGSLQTSTGSSTRTAKVTFKTSRTVLSGFLPSDRFSHSDDTRTVIDATWIATTQSNVPWLGGGRINSLALYIPGIRYKKDDGTAAEGSFPVVIFKDCPEAVTSDREELGLPTLFADLAMSVDEQGGVDGHGHGQTFTATASLRGVEFARMTLKDLLPTTGENSRSFFAKDAILTHRYLPAIGRAAKADVDHAVLLSPPVTAQQQPPARLPGSTPRTTHAADVQLLPGHVGSLPTLDHIVARLANLPGFDIPQGQLTEEPGIETYGTVVKL